MTSVIQVSEIKFVASGPADAERGLLGFLSCVVAHGLRLDGLTLRRTSDGRFSISYPARRDAAGRQHFFVRPTDEVIRCDIENQVLEALDLEEEERE